MEVTSHRGYGIGTAARHDVKERFFLDRIHMFGAELSVDQAIKRAATVFTHSADATGTVTDQAPEPAEAAADLRVTQTFVKHSFFHAEPPENMELNPI
jgi:hypothetical protein